MAHENKSTNNNPYNQQERDALSAELTDAATTYERLLEISDELHDKGVYPEVGIADMEPTADITSMTDEELSAQLRDPKVSGETKDIIAKHVARRQEDTPGKTE